ncbi:MAG: helix-turn-helix domain-containing protein [Oscillospiraceae bacterium]|nr:helix-turn-helix domain-containing protein [Oscillospiraceae bacterium]
MNEQQVLSHLRELNDSEIFYRNYRLAKASPAGFSEYLERIDRQRVYRENLLVPEWKDTIPPEYLEDWYFSADRREGIHVFKHNCYTPAIPHHHNFFEMFFVLDGHCIHKVGENTAVLHAGDLCLIQPKVTHSLDVNDESIIIDVLIRRATFRHYFYSILQGDNVLSNFFMSTLYSNPGIDYLLFHTQNDPDLHYAFIDLCGESFDQEAYYTVLVNAIVTRIFVLLLRRYMSSCELPKDKPADSEIALTLARYLQANAADVTLAKLAEDFHYSTEYSSRLIKRSTGQTFIQLLTNIRLENAKQLLRDTTLSVTDIAMQVGYESSEHFIRTFRKHIGSTPSEYRHQ